MGRSHCRWVANARYGPCGLVQQLAAIEPPPYNHTAGEELAQQDPKVLTYSATQSVDELAIAIPPPTTDRPYIP